MHDELTSSAEGLAYSVSCGEGTKSMSGTRIKELPMLRIEFPGVFLVEEARSPAAFEETAL
jgi:hypothetical protein